MSGNKHTAGPRRAIKGGDKLEWERLGCGFVLGPDNETVVGRFPRYEDAILDAAAPDLLAALINLRAYTEAYRDAVADLPPHKKEKIRLAVVANGGTETASHALIAASAAIAKATEATS